MSGKRKVPSTEGSKQSKSKKSRVDPLQRSLLSFFQPLDGSRREDQQEELENVHDGENTDDDFDMVQQDEEDNGTQQKTAATGAAWRTEHAGFNGAFVHPRFHTTPWRQQGVVHCTRTWSARAW